MKLRDGALLLTRIYLVAPSSVQVKENLQGVLRNLIIEIEEHGYSADKTALTNIQSIADSTIKSFIDDAQVQAQLSVIVDKVNNDKMQKHIALEQVYNLYCQNKTNKRICENLATLCNMCIMEYVIGQKSYRNKVTNILDQLENNQSSVFTSFSSVFSESYHAIWNKLDASTRLLLLRGSFGNTSLSSQGYALKAGLEYYKTFGRVRTTSGFGSIFDGLNF